MVFVARVSRRIAALRPCGRAGRSVLRRSLARALLIGGFPMFGLPSVVLYADDAGAGEKRL